jgi:hypothetical protein
MTTATNRLGGSNLPRRGQEAPQRALEGTSQFLGPFVNLPLRRNTSGLAGTDETICYVIPAAISDTER